MRGYFKILAVVITILVISQISSSVMPEIVVNETDLVKIDINVDDPDSDDMEIEYGYPLNSSGMWQTTYGDYGEYVINVSATDGKLKSIQTFRLVVKKINWPPEIEDLDNIVIDEGDSITITPDVSDPEGDDINIHISNPIGDDGIWETSFNDAGEYSVTVTASDSKNSIQESFQLTVKNINRVPKINSYSPKDLVEVKEGDSLEFNVKASDLDGEDLRYIWEVDDEQVSKELIYIYSPGFNASGNHKVVVYVSDKETTIKQIWDVNVLNTNRAPVLENIEDIIADETSVIEVEIPATDPDGDMIYYSISDPIGDDKKWETTYDDSGEYIVDLKVSDGVDEVDSQFKVIINNVDRAPLFENIEDVSVNENEELRIKLNAKDLDGDDISFIAEDAPIGASIKGGEFIYTPGYDIVSSNTIIDNIYSVLRLDSILPSVKTFNVLFIASANGVETKQRVKIKVFDTNQPPYLMDLENITVYELDVVNVVPEAIEYDNDRVSFTISSPIGNDGKWKTDYNSHGEYEIFVTASDGKDKDVKSFILTVNNMNREPSIELDEVKVNENQTLRYKPTVSDPDGDEVFISIEEGPYGAEVVDNELIWRPSFDSVSKEKDGFINKIISKFSSLNRKFNTDLEGYAVSLSASDDEDSVVSSTTLIVKDVNRIPVLVNASPVSALVTHVGDSVVFSVDAKDLDGDNLSYTWHFNSYEAYKGMTKIRRVFTTPGDKTVKVYIDDGYTAIIKKWRVRVLPKAEKKIVKSRALLTETYIVDNVEDNSDSGIIQFEI